MTLHPHHRDAQEPYPMKAKKNGECVECETPIYIGDDIVWDPKEFKVYCIECGQEFL